MPLPLIGIEDSQSTTIQGASATSSHIESQPSTYGGVDMRSTTIQGSGGSVANTYLSSTAHSTNSG
jgi:hypothetical protein